LALNKAARETGRSLIKNRAKCRQLQVKSGGKRRNLEARFKLNAESEVYIIGNLEKKGKCGIELVSAVTDSQGDTVAELTALYFIKRLRR
jgi:hypothetical protein